MELFDLYTDEELAEGFLRLKNLRRVIFALDVAGAKALKEDGGGEFSLSEAFLRASEGVREVYAILGGTFLEAEDD